MTLIDYKKLILGLFLGSIGTVGMSPHAIGLTPLQSEMALYEPVQPSARITVVAHYWQRSEPDGEIVYHDGEMADLDAQDLELLQSRPLTYAANRLLVQARQKNGMPRRLSTDPFILPTRHRDLAPLWALLLKSDVRNITCDLVVDAVCLADYLCLHDPEVLSKIYNRPEEGQLSRFFKELARSNMPVLAKYYERLHDAGQREGAQELEQFILPYMSHVLYRTLPQERLGEVGNEDPARGHTRSVNSVALLPDGNTLVSGSLDRTIIIWRKDAVTGEWHMGQRLGEVGNEDPAQGHTGWVCLVAGSSDGNTLASSSRDRTIIIWRKDVLVYCKSVRSEASVSFRSSINSLWQQKFAWLGHLYSWVRR